MATRILVPYTLLQPPERLLPFGLEVALSLKKVNDICIVFHGKTKFCLGFAPKVQMANQPFQE
jgi:hypothetical protein